MKNSVFKNMISSAPVFETMLEGNRGGGDGERREKEKRRLVFL